MNIKQSSINKLSIIVPVYNRPNEIQELLESMVEQTNKEFDVIIIEDGSTIKCDSVCETFRKKLSLQYYYKENSGPAQSRNYGYEKATSNYCIFVDSDCILPPHYIQTIYTTLKNHYVDAFGGPDKAHQKFSILQKAVNYSMTSFFTTGGIRGSSEKMEKFHPRSFNMGFSREVFEKTGGFPSFRFAKAKAAGEDLDLSIQIKKLGFITALIPDAFVYHKRRTSLQQFYNQVFNFGVARISIYQRHPESLKILHAFPALFIFVILLLVVLSIFISAKFFIPIFFYAIIVFIDSTIKNKNLSVGIVSVITSFTQLIGYGCGFIYAFWKKAIMKKDKI